MESRDCNARRRVVLCAISPSMGQDTGIAIQMRLYTRFSSILFSLPPFSSCPPGHDAPDQIYTCTFTAIPILPSDASFCFPLCQSSSCFCRGDPALGDERSYHLFWTSPRVLTLFTKILTCHVFRCSFLLWRGPSPFTPRRAFFTKAWGVPLAGVFAFPPP